VLARRQFEFKLGSFGRVFSRSYQISCTCQKQVMTT
jgi:hypothetical protein